MTVFVPMVMFGWIPVIFAAFAVLPARRAVIAGFIAAWLFMPVAAYEIRGFPDYTKLSAICLGILAASAVFDFARFLRFRPSIADIPIVIWCTAPFFSSLLNGLGAYEGLSGAAKHVIGWGIPYVLGRVYFRDPDHLKDLAVGMFLGGLVYLPLCISEIIFGPELHNLLYGYHQHSLDQAVRFGGWRPMVFMRHGLMVGVWMASASVIGLFLMASKNKVRVLGFSMRYWMIPLLGTCVLLKSANAWILLALGVLLVVSARWLRAGAMMWGLTALIVVYIFFRATGIWSGAALVDVTSRYVDEERARSLAFRFKNERVLAEKARERPVLGWDGWGRHLVHDADGNPVAVSESLWIIAFGQYGAVGLAAITGVLLVPVTVFVRRCSFRRRLSDSVAPAAALSSVLLLYMIDNLVNAMVNPVFTLVAGALVGYKCVDPDRNGGDAAPG